MEQDKHGAATSQCSWLPRSGHGLVPTPEAPSGLPRQSGARQTGRRSRARSATSEPKLQDTGEPETASRRPRSCTHTPSARLRTPTTSYNEASKFPIFPIPIGRSCTPRGKRERDRERERGKERQRRKKERVPQDPFRPMRTNKNHPCHQLLVFTSRDLDPELSFIVGSIIDLVSHFVTAMSKGTPRGKQEKERAKDPETPCGQREPPMSPMLN